MSKSFAGQKVVVIVISSIMSGTTALEWGRS